MILQLLFFLDTNSVKRITINIVYQKQETVEKISFL